MCYAKPGPRCSGHVQEQLANAESKRQAYFEQGDLANAKRIDSHIHELRQEWLGTPDGIKWLRENGETHNANLLERERERKIEAWKHAHHGDDKPVPLKDKTAAGLSREILDATDNAKDAQLLNNALSIAFHAHREHSRHTPIMASSGDARNDPEYIYHPLRNTVRLTRWGVRDMGVLSASVLHDTVEDAPEKVMTWNSKGASRVTADEHEVQKAALKRIETMYAPHGYETARILKAVTNPISEPGQTREQKNATYLKHVSHEISDPQVFLVKFADICDNAMSLHHTPESQKRRNLAKKYLPLAPVFQEKFKSLKGDLREKGLVGEDGLKDIEKRINGMGDYLSRLSQE